MHIYDTHLVFLEPLSKELKGFADVTSGILRAREVLEIMDCTFALGRSCMGAPLGPSCFFSPQGHDTQSL